MAGWQLQRDLVLVPGLRLRLHRIGLAHWRAGARLRSWGVAPLHREGDTLHAPCAAGEALWIGGWLDEDDNGHAELQLHDAAAGLQATAVLPADFQLTTLGGTQPITLARSGAARTFALAVTHAGRHTCIALQLLPPADWALRTGRPAPAAPAAPPPLPPRYG